MKLAASTGARDAAVELRARLRAYEEVSTTCAPLPSKIGSRIPPRRGSNPRTSTSLHRARAPVRQLYEVVSIGDRHRLRLAADLQLGKYPLDMARDCLWADHELFGDVRGTTALGEKLEDLELASGEISV
jgi:hypothetical protein